MFRLLVLADLVFDELYPAAVEMIEGTYWSHREEQSAPEYCDRGSFEVGGGDEG